MKHIIDPVTRQTVSISLVGNIATMSCNGVWLTETIRQADLSVAKCCILKRDLEGFASFFERAEKREAA